MPEQPANTKAEPMTYEVTQMPRPVMARRAAVASQAEGMSMEELKTAAADLQIDTSGLRSKTDYVDAVQGSIRPAPAE